MSIRMSKKWGFSIAGIILLILGAITAVILSQRQQNLEQEAAEPSACIETQATCAWDPVPGAASYQYQIIDVESGGQIVNGVANGATQVTFNMTPGREYKCTVVAVNSCGTGEPGEGTAACTPPTGTPTVPPSNTPTSPPTNTPIPSATPTVPPSTTPLPTNTPTIPPSICPVPSKVTNVRVICPNCSTN